MSRGDVVQYFSSSGELLSGTYQGVTNTGRVRLQINGTIPRQVITTINRIERAEEQAERAERERLRRLDADLAELLAAGLVAVDYDDEGRPHFCATTGEHAHVL